MMRMKKYLFAVGAAIGLFLLLFLASHLAYSDKILPQVYAGIVPVGGLSQDRAAEIFQKYADALAQQGLLLSIDGKTEVLRLDNLEFNLSVEESAKYAWQVGRRGSWFRQFGERLKASFRQIVIRPKVEVNQQSLMTDIDALADVVDVPRKDVRFLIEKAEVEILTDTRPGRVIDREQLFRQVLTALKDLDTATIVVALQEDLPKVSSASAPQAKEDIERVISDPLILKHGSDSFVISREQIGTWLIAGYSNNKLVPALDREAVGSHIATIAEEVNLPAQTLKISVENGKVIEFIPPRPGKGLDEDKTIELIAEILERRRIGTAIEVAIELPVKEIKTAGEAPEGFEGITELIGRATTTFTGSPKNRIHNIKNGARLLTGHVIKPGEEFSTLAALGKVDNTTGYLPELVIKGTRTIPEFGGGLCQVSTTLFRSLLNAGLPITARRNHSYRVSYYEKDENGKFIGPGLDATIYQSNPDLKFKNDTAHPILVYGYVYGDKITFELYGTRDGRTSKIEGPTLLTETAAGPPIYAETDTLPRGTVKQVEVAHPGGSTKALYSVTYPDGRVENQEFKSFYRRWPARFLVGTKDQQAAAQ